MMKGNDIVAEGREGRHGRRHAGQRVPVERRHPRHRHGGAAQVVLRGGLASIRRGASPPAALGYHGNMRRIHLATGLTALLLCASGQLHAPLVAQNAQQKTPSPKLEAKVYLTPTCGCCGKWTEHLQAAGFTVSREVTSQLDAVPERQRVPAVLRTCHTAVVGKYLVEGHVPADVIKKMLKEAARSRGSPCPACRSDRRGWKGPTRVRTRSSRSTPTVPPPNSPESNDVQPAHAADHGIRG